MKRQAQVVGANKGVFHYSNGMIGTADLPEMLKSFDHAKRRVSHKTAFMLNNIAVPKERSTLNFRGQIARAWARRVH